MNTTFDEQTLTEIVTARPNAVRVLEKFGLDYCCGGQRKLDEACAEQGVEIETVRAALDDIPEGPAPDWAGMNLTQLVDHLESTHHNYLKSEFPRLDALSAKVLSVHGDRHPELKQVRDTFLELRSDLDPHLMKEERVLFPMIRELDAATAPPQFHCGSLQNPISVMMVEHETAGDLLRTLRTVAGDYVTPADGCASFEALYTGLAELEADTHLHIHKENNSLFPRVVALETKWSSHAQTETR